MGSEMEIYQSGTTELSVSRAPEIVLAEAQRAAEALREVVAKKAKPVIFNGEQYLEFEDWQTCAKFYGLTAKVRSSQFIQYGNVIGFEASADAIQVATGQIVSSADSMCLNDEENWSTRAQYEWKDELDEDGNKIWIEREGKKRPKQKRVKVGEVAVPLFQLRSMAQTRACAKALRNVLAWVVVLAGYKPSLAEEMTGRSPESGKTAPSMPQRKSESSEIISEPQRKRFFAIWKGAGIPDDIVKAKLKEHSYESSTEIKKSDYEMLCTWAENFGKSAPSV